MITSFGAQLHVAGTDAAALKTAVTDAATKFAAQAEPMSPSLEDIFIHTMTQAHVEAEQ